MSATIDKLLIAALVDNNDIMALANLRAAARKMKAAGVDAHKLTVSPTPCADGSSFWRKRHDEQEAKAAAIRRAFRIEQKTVETALVKITSMAGRPRYTPLHANYIGEPPVDGAERRAERMEVELRRLEAWRYDVQREAAQLKLRMEEIAKLASGDAS